MADALVSIVLEKLGSIVLDGIKEEVSLIVGVKKEIKSLTDTLTIIQGVLEDTEEKQVKNKAVKLWLEEFKDISYDAEDILDEWRTRSLIPHTEQSDPVIKRKVQSKLLNLLSCFCFKPVIIRHEIGIKIRELNERLVGIVEKKQLYNLNQIRSKGVHKKPTIAVPDVPMIYGRDNEKNILINKLLSESSTVNLHVPVISIVGTGGFGKTTLAQLILKDEKVITSFDKMIWVCVSDPFLVENVAKEIIQQAKGNVPETIGWQALHSNLSECVKGKRFILVLDDVWPCSNKEWMQLKSALDCGAARSRIIVTSRSERTAKMIKSSYIHSLGQLSDDDCWSLFKCIAFSGRGENDIDMYEDIGIKISKKCKGVPLAVKVIASLMCLKTTKQEWRDVLASNIWDVEEEGEGFLPSILLSYYALPSCLKPCLLYCAVLPKDSYIVKEEMVKLWMAQGYLGSDDDGSADLEMKGRDYFDNLAMLSFFQDFEKDDEGKITGCKMHDLVHDFVQFLTKNETIILEENKVSSTVKVRHLCAGDLSWSSIYQQKNLRTLRSHWKKYNTLALELFHQLTCLRALSLRDCGIQELPSEVESLLHLRYLDLSENSRLVELPETVCNLLNLQTLDLRGCISLIRLPEAIAKLSSSLRHLCIKGCNKLKYMPVGVEKLRWLRTLEKFIVGGCGEENKEKGCTIGELRLLNHIEGSLKIIGLDASNAAQAELKMKEKLRSLKMIFRLEEEEEEDSEEEEEEDDDDEEEVEVGMEGVLDDLEPHPNLEKLKLEDYEGIRLPDWFSSMSNLTKLTLKDLLYCLQLPALGKLKSLEVLQLVGLYSVKRLGSEFYGLDDTSNRQVIFPKLKDLTIENMEDCEEWELPILNEVDFFPNLIRLEVDGFGGVLPALGKLKSLEFLILSDIRWQGLKHSLDELFGIPTTASYIVVFPALKSLKFSNMRLWEEKAVIMRKEGEEEQGCNNGITIMPSQELMVINNCRNLKVIPFYMFSHELLVLNIRECPQLSLLQGLNQLTSIRTLEFESCENLHFGPDDLKHLTMLEELRIVDCPILAERFRGGGEISSSTTHVYNITIFPEPINVNVHSDFSCDNCEIYPIVGKRYKCKDCYHEGVVSTRGTGYDLCEKCYGTPSKHPDLANQHHKEGHTFELIANRGDNPVPVHPDDPSEDAEGGLVVAKSAEIDEQIKLA